MIFSIQKYFTALFLFIAFSLILNSNLSHAQSMNEGIEYYQQGDFEQAIQIFNDIDTPRGRLFAGKSYYSLGQYLTAKTYLNQVSQEAQKEIYLEAEYTTALVDFQLGLYGDALNRLYDLKNQSVKTQLVTNGRQLYNEILGFLTLDQRKRAFQQAKLPEIKYDLIKAAIGTVPLEDARTLYSQLVQSKIDTTSSAMRELSETIDDSVSYATERRYGNQIRAPKGIIYDLGAALPSHSNSGSEFQVSRGLHFGYVMAAEEFNRQHTDKKAFVRHENTAANMDSAGHAMTNLAWNYHADVVLGPLFSDPARKMADLAEQYHIPLVAPLANSDSLNLDNPYVYQANPTFTSHGRKMAEYAVQNLQMDTLAVLAEKNSLGEASAFAFRDRAEKLGAKVAYFFVEDLKSKGFDLTDYTKFFTTDSAKIDSLGNYHYLDGIYAPFTGQAASTLAELLLVDMEAKGSNIPVMGSQEWGNFEIPEIQIKNQPIYFSESYYINQKSERVQQFKEMFKQRFDSEPNRFAMIGYDVASYVLETLNRVENPSYLKNALKSQPMYEGIISNINFKGSHINQEVKIFEITENGIRPVIKQD
ncbi:ABC transporter substrate-binding protein [Fodinibius sp.]|uniref:ABC transporter substrate-binding protein n=1 Tax=Fodinibius sp. TaxID=1872440 RepID=UPI002ACE2AAD|nr:ABC transporter substrate-binding protein [Fodinibius sp.]MDZ7660263.1 ABC transporter substrate-binding protein [Fodinibius sp.]